MQQVNLDLLRAATRPADPHAQHMAEHLQTLRAARRQRWLDRIDRLRNLLRQHRVPRVQACPEHRP